MPLETVDRNTNIKDVGGKGSKGNEMHGRESQYRLREYLNHKHLFGRNMDIKAAASEVSEGSKCIFANRR